MKGFKIGVLGAGSWGTALALLLGKKGEDVIIWGRREKIVDTINERGENPVYLPGVPLPQNIRATKEIEEAVLGKDVIVLAVPSFAMREVVTKLARIPLGDAILVSASKGLEEESGKRMSEVILEIMPDVSQRLLVLSGPNLAGEIVKEVPTTSVVAGEERLSCIVQELFATHYFRVYRNEDIIGVELGGALKNIIAIGAGINDGLGFGDNTKSALMTRGLAEMIRLGLKLGASLQTFFGLAGLGDLVATCASPLSRNRRLGELIAKGLSLEEAKRKIGQVAEGEPTTRAAYNLAQSLGVEMPITCEIYKVLFQGKAPRQAVIDLMTRPLKPESYP
ncbi:NAD(P)-dependent glycerol-3-phosphate dehydrogenase [bacterium]|nr:NAD(P)-dependent glycerol-3-phosphate dehydrogenase [bacterium]